MTHRYFMVRRALYEMNIRKDLTPKRDISTLGKLYKWPQWIISIGVVVLILIFIILVITLSKKWDSRLVAPGFLILALLVTITIIQEILREQHKYKMDKRDMEIQKQEEAYKEYIIAAREVLTQQDINSQEHLLLLKN